MKNQKMFADLVEIYKGNLGDEIEVEIYTEENHYTYKVFASYKGEPSDSMATKTFTSSTKKSYIDKAIRNSYKNFSCDINYNDKLLTLITCDSTR